MRQLDASDAGGTPGGRVRRRRPPSGKAAAGPLLAASPEYRARRRQRGGAERTRTACRARSRFRTYLSGRNRFRSRNEGNSTRQCEADVPGFYRDPYGAWVAWRENCFCAPRRSPLSNDFPWSPQGGALLPHLDESANASPRAGICSARSVETPHPLARLLESCRGPILLSTPLGS